MSDVHELIPFGARAPVRGLVALSIEGPADEEGRATMTVWHGTS